MISDSILQTLKYSDHFDFPLTINEIHQRLIRVHVGATFTVARTLAKMLQKKQIGKRGEYYHLPGRSNLVSRRRKNSSTSESARLKAQDFARQLSQVPGVLAIYLTGSLAMSNSTENSDIDFMIITQNGRLWTTRFVLTIFTSIIGLRRTPRSKRNTGKLCLNLYLSPKSYLLPASKRSLYTAYELIQAIPLYDPYNTHRDLLSVNSWICSYLPNFPLPKGRLLDRRPGQRPRRDTESGRSLPVGVLEFILFHLQFFYMKSKITREHITRDCAFFHPHNPAPRV